VSGIRSLLTVHKLAGPGPRGPDGALPLLGLAIDGDLPQVHEFPTSWLMRGVAEGWLEMEGELAFDEPFRPPPWGESLGLVWVEGSFIKLKTIGGDTVYRVTSRAGHHEDPAAGPTPARPELGDPGHPVGYRVDRFYVGQLVTA